MTSVTTAVLLLHGWPDSILRFEKVLPLLSDLHLVVPALPGFPFAAPVDRRGLSSAAMAEAVAGAMAELGHDRYVVSAGDVGCDVAEALAAAHPDRVAALHLTDVSQYRFLVDTPRDLSATERAYVRHGHEWQAAEGGYMHEQSTKPHTLAVGLGDSPAGLAAWILEKLRAWTDCEGAVENVFTRDEVLTWITAYWVSGAIGTSFTPYAESGAKPAGRIEVARPPSPSSRRTSSTPRARSRPASSTSVPGSSTPPVATSRRGSARRSTRRAYGRRWDWPGDDRGAGIPPPSAPPHPLTPAPALPRVLPPPEVHRFTNR
jgi:pimeloyl-ACP methyl ester carboxylesterase